MGEEGERTLGKERLVHQLGDNVRVPNRVVVARSKDVGRDDRRKVVAELVVVSAVLGQSLVQQPPPPGV